MYGCDLDNRLCDGGSVGEGWERGIPFVLSRVFRKRSDIDRRRAIHNSELFIS